LHTELLRTNLFPDFDRLFPGRFVNQTNGVTPRRWLAQANPGLAALIDRRIGTGWRTRLDELAMLAPFAADARFCAEFAAVKAANKLRLAQALARVTGVAIRPDSLFDVQIKRIHEYKRQLLNVLHVITRYHRILAEPDADWLPRTAIFAGKAASAYAMAKLIIRLVNDVARTINADPRVGDRLRVAFMPNYGVSAAMAIIPAADLSEQISTAGTEASGTGNMKLALNGALTIGTEDGANIEIRDAVGAGNIFIFGHTAGEVRHLRTSGYDPRALRDEDPELAAVLDALGAGAFSPDEPDRYAPIVRALLDHGDHYLLLADYASYVMAQERVDTRYRDRAAWTEAAVRNVAAMGGFSSDRAVRDYADEIWRVRPLAH
jgi:starch phosphorylase